VTGGSRGIGAATSRLAAEQGYAVAVNFLSQREAADRVVRAIEQAGGTALAIQADIGSERDVCRLFETVDKQLAGAFLCAREAVRRMSTRRGGRGGAIVNVSSGAARLGSPNEYVDYAASKGALDTMTIGLAREVAEEGIRVNAVRPGFIYTDMHAAGGEPNRVDTSDLLVRNG